MKELVKREIIILFIIIIFIIPFITISQGKTDSPPPPHGVPVSGGPWKWEVTYSPELEKSVIIITNYLCDSEFSFKGPSTSLMTVRRGETKYTVLNSGYYDLEVNNLPDQSCINRGSGDVTFDEHYIYHLIGGDGEIPDVSNITKENASLDEASNPINVESSQIASESKEDSFLNEPIKNCNDCHSILHNIWYKPIFLSDSEDYGWHYATPFSYITLPLPNIFGFIPIFVEFYEIPEECGFNSEVSC